MLLVRTCSELRHVAPRRPILVPTMGALHDGHASLIRQAVRLSRESGSALGAAPAPVLVSIFVNPTQFGERDDFSRYPRTLDADLPICEQAGADVVFAPSPAEIYPAGRTVRIPPLPAVATQPGLEDAQRPGHFAGVCQVVLRLFELITPGHAVFGEKDWQQLQVVRAMTAHERLPIEIVPGATVRESDGLAMSSRNRFLSPADRRRAGSIVRALRASRDETSPDLAEACMRDELAAAGIEPDYAVVREASTLTRSPHTGPHASFRALIAARVGPVRLLDNAPWGPQSLESGR
ncbi:MAG: pantoate--beta-alanine ligase [Phycisphaerales bacterium]